MENIKNTMRAIARLMMLLICMMSFTGISATTDLSQNSDAISVFHDYDVGVDMGIDIVVTQDLVLEPISELKLNSFKAKITNQKEQEQLTPIQAGTDKQKPPLIQAVNRGNYNYKNYRNIYLAYPYWVS